MNIGEKIHARRLELKMTTTELGRLVGIQSSAVSKYEKGRIEPKTSMIKAFAKALNVSPVSLLPDDPSTEQEKLIDAYWKAEPVYREVAMDILLQHPSKKESETMTAG